MADPEESNEPHLNEPSFEKVNPEENMDPEEFESKGLHLNKPSSENPIKKILRLPNINKLIFPENPNSYKFKYEDLKFKGRLGNSQYDVKSYKHEPTNKDVAVKIIPIPFDEYRDPCTEYKMTSLLREIEVHQKLKTSSNIVKLYGICLHDGDLWICMEPMDKSLEDWYPEIHVEHQCFPEWILGYVTVSVLNSLLDLKEHQIIHRDIKPTNILVNKNREIKLCDFGTSRIMENNLATTSNVGTYLYWPPERSNYQIEAYDERNDIWSLGITIAEVILGKGPYHLQENFGTPILLEHRILNTSVDDILNKCFKKGDLRNYILAPGFLRKCLEEYMNRPGCKNLIETRFYKEHIKITKEMVANSMNKKSRVNKNNFQRKDQFVEKRQRSQSFVIFMKTDEHDHLLQKIRSSKRRSSSIAHTGVIKGSKNGFNIGNNSENISIGSKNMKNDKDHISDASHAYTDLYKCNNGKRKIDMLVFQESI